MYTSPAYSLEVVETHAGKLSKPLTEVNVNKEMEITAQITPKSDLYNSEKVSKGGFFLELLNWLYYGDVKNCMCPWPILYF